MDPEAQFMIKAVRSQGVQAEGRIREWADAYLAYIKVIIRIRYALRV